MSDKSANEYEVEVLTKSNLLLPGDQVIPVAISLAEAFGLETSMILQQLYFLLKNKTNGKKINGHRWIYNTYKQWKKDHFPWMSLMTVRRRFAELEKAGLIESCQPERRFSRRKYYRLLLDRTIDETTKPPSVHLVQLKRSTGTDDKTSE